jgi:hypothetical protein
LGVAFFRPREKPFNVIVAHIYSTRSSGGRFPELSSAFLFASARTSPPSAISAAISAASISAAVIERYRPPRAGRHHMGCGLRPLLGNCGNRPIAGSDRIWRE